MYQVKNYQKNDDFEEPTRQGNGKRRYARLSASFGVSLDRSPRHPPFCVLRTPIFALFSFHFYTFLSSFGSPRQIFCVFPCLPQAFRGFPWAVGFWLHFGSILVGFGLNFGMLFGVIFGTFWGPKVRQNGAEKPLNKSIKKSHQKRECVLECNFDAYLTDVDLQNGDQVL